MSKEIAAALIGAGGALVGFLLSEFFTLFRRRNDKKVTFLMANYSQRQQAYAAIYAALTKFHNYFYLFVENGNEFKKHSDPEEFGPLSAMMELTETYELNQIWLNETTTIHIQELLGDAASANNIAVYVAMGEKEIGIDQVTPISDMMITRIDETKKHIKKMTGMLLLDDYQVKFIKIS